MGPCELRKDTTFDRARVEHKGCIVLVHCKLLIVGMIDLFVII